ncbi:DUF6894 family protein [Rhizobium sp. WSM1325]|uniref:DUF6894 domain-containing protein n=1 Tax=Rhizobium leguminosarum bv. trifolii (strain WSM1325) TaxID=395491 RepID=C6B9G8_RHILS|nr:hypothetical protein [Rhizobium leguminosarum]ACS60556.1 conserved hypothetical protein [Rhizobium leguminosarum bv. trifolii WSM1325]RWY66962.1 hypothetical protein EHI48_31550 [Rhizobium leguminosarum]
MPRFFFHILTRTNIIRDEEGTDLTDLGAARSEAIKDARGMMSMAIREGRDLSHRHIEICDAVGTLLLKVAFSEAYEPGD